MQFLRSVCSRLLKLFRSAPVFDWHNKQISGWKETFHQMEMLLEKEKQHCKALQSRLDEWIERREGKVDHLYRRLEIQRSTIEDYMKAHAWIKEETKLIYPNLLDRMRANVKIVRYATVKKPYNGEP